MSESSLPSFDAFGSPAYGLTRLLEGVPFQRALQKVRAALDEEGFGVLTEIDVKVVLENKLKVATRPYTILGACSPQLAKRALDAEPPVGLLLPCNVVVAEDADGQTVVSIADPVALLAVTGRKALEPIARDARTRLERALASIRS